jgi:rhombotail lipoprotein
MIQLRRLALPAVLALASCSSTIDRRGMRESLAAPRVGASVDAPEILASVDVAAGAEPESTLRSPFVLAIAPPLSHRRTRSAWNERTETAVGTRSWTQAERAAIEAWRPELVELGLVSDLVVIPMLTVGVSAKPGDPLAVARTAAARHHADAVLVVSEVEDSSSWLNPWSILDLTIIGAWFAPGHDVEVVTILEGVVLDVRSGYLHASGQGEGDVRERRAWVHADDPALSLEARTEALSELGRDLMEQARRAAPLRADR